MYISWLVLLIVVTHCIVVTVCGQQPCTYVMFASVTTAAYPPLRCIALRPLTFSQPTFVFFCG